MDITEILNSIRQFLKAITVTDVICLTGLILFAVWLLKTSWGTNALEDSTPRRNSMPVYLPFLSLFIWMGAVALTISIIRTLLPDLPKWQGVFTDNVVFCIGAAAGMGVVIFLAREHFARRLKGFGLNVRTIHKDFGAAVVNLLCVWPLVLLMMVVTAYLGRLICGPDFQIKQHQELEMMTTYSQLEVRVLIVVTVVAIVPAFEEMLFRGLFQTVIRSFLGESVIWGRLRSKNLMLWLAIVLSSVLFTLVHYEPAHWPALFVLAMCLGYAYEKSGSLFRPIFIHSLFNATSVLAALNQ